MSEAAIYQAQNDVLVPKNAELLSQKDGIRVYRVAHAKSTAVLKLFDQPKHLHEIENYALLQKLDIPTLEIYEVFPSALLMEDLAASPRLRLAKEEDLHEPELIRALAEWYRCLHSRGKTVVAEPASHWYSEADLVNQDLLAWIPKLTQTEDWPIWKRLHHNWLRIRAFEASLDHTLCYHDFWWVNLAVAHDLSKALMFDYNLLGRGLAMTDFRNVMAGLPAVSQDLFKEAYGCLPPEEALADELYSPLVGLCIGLRLAQQPAWLDEEWEKVKTGALDRALDAVLAYLEAKDAP
jgi:hypothetical protein